MGKRRDVVFHLSNLAVRRPFGFHVHCKRRGVGITPQTGAGTNSTEAFLCVHQPTLSVAEDIDSPRCGDHKRRHRDGAFCPP
jgi:hypothetical protein